MEVLDALEVVVLLDAEEEDELDVEVALVVLSVVVACRVMQGFPLWWWAC